MKGGERERVITAMARAFYRDDELENDGFGGDFERALIGLHEAGYAVVPRRRVNQFGDRVTDRLYDGIISAADIAAPETAMGEETLKPWEAEILRYLSGGIAATAMQIGKVVWSNMPSSSAMAAAHEYLRLMEPRGLVRRVDDRTPFFWELGEEGNALFEVRP